MAVHYNIKAFVAQFVVFLSTILVVHSLETVLETVYYDPDLHLNVPQSVRRHGYRAEAHTVETADGYILTTHRILSQRCDNEVRLPVFIQHGFSGTSWLWVLQGPGKALAYVLADAGYDVWLGNARGNPDSRAHANLPPSSSLFWDFSFHEMGVYDLPAVFEHIANVTGAPQLHYIGHSMGTTMFFAMASLKPGAAARVASMHALAPVVFASHMTVAMRRLAKYANDVEFLSLLMGDGELQPQTRFLKFVARLGCELILEDKRLCTRYDFAATGGSDPTQYNASLTPLLLAHRGTGASTKTAVHYLQLMKTGKFRQFDHGFLGNIAFYNSTVPPEYNLSKINVPVYLYYARADPTADPTDVAILFEKLMCKKEKYLVPWPTFNHMDFVVAKDAKKLVYDHILKNLHSSPPKDPLNTDLNEVFSTQYDELFEVIML